MKTFVVLFFGAFLCGVLAEPLRYRQPQQVRASAKQTDGGVALQAELGDSANEANEDQDTQNDEGKPDQRVTEPSIYQSAPAPYPPRGWVPFGQLLVLPVAVRENLESTTTVESSTFNDEATEETPTTETQATNGQVQEVETSEPKTKSAAHKRPGSTIIIVKGKKVGELKVEAKQEAKQEPKEESTESNQTSTENDDEATTTADPKSENLETTSEPDAEAVDVEKANEEGKQVTNAQVPQVPQSGFFIQLPDGTFQRIVYVAPQAPQAQAAFIPQPASVPFQQLNQSPNSPFGYNPITNPRIVTFSSQYNAW